MRRITTWIVAGALAGCSAEQAEQVEPADDPAQETRPFAESFEQSCAYGTSGTAGAGWEPLAPTLTEVGSFTMESCRLLSAEYGNAKACVERGDIQAFKYKFWFQATPGSDIIHGNFKNVDMTCAMSIDEQLALMSYDILPGPGQPAIDCASQPAAIAIGGGSWEELGVDTTQVASRSECEAYAVERARVRACEQRSDIAAYLAKAWFADPVAGLTEITFPQASCGG